MQEICFDSLTFFSFLYFFAFLIFVPSFFGECCAVWPRLRHASSSIRQEHPHHPCSANPPYQAGERIASGTSVFLCASSRFENFHRSNVSRVLFVSRRDREPWRVRTVRRSWEFVWKISRHCSGFCHMGQTGARFTRRKNGKERAKESAKVHFGHSRHFRFFCFINFLRYTDLR